MGLTWPEAGDVPGGPVPDLVYRLFDVDHVAEQLTWLHTQGWRTPALPNGGRLCPWPTEGDAVEALGYLELSFGAPFSWRRQLPLFRFDQHVYTFVLAGDHEGEIWRYEIDPDTEGPARAATSLAALLAHWTRGIRAGVLRISDLGPYLVIGDGTPRGTTTWSSCFRRRHSTRWLSLCT